MPAFDPAFDIGFDIGAGSSLGLGFGFGFDPFDSYMNAVCSILTNQRSPADAYGQREQGPESFTSLADNVPCRVSDKAIGRPHEQRAGEKFSTNFKTIFMRPPELSDGDTLNPHHWIFYNGTIDPLTGMITPLAPNEQIYFDIFEVRNPSRANHHLELIVRQLVP